MAASRRNVAFEQGQAAEYTRRLEDKVEQLENELKRVSTPSAATPANNFNATAPATEYGTTSSFDSGLAKSPPVPDGPEQATIEAITCEPTAKRFGIDMFRQLWILGNKLAGLPTCTDGSPMQLAESFDQALPMDLYLAVELPLLPEYGPMSAWIDLALNQALILWPFVDRPQVDWALQRKAAKDFGEEESDSGITGLLYALVALGQRFDRTVPAHTPHDRRMQGIGYLSAARAMVLPTDSHQSLEAIQTLMCIVVCLKASSAQTLAHTVLGEAISAAQRVSLHEPALYLPKAEAARRTRVWSALQTLDILLSTSLGLPHTSNSCPGGPCKALPSREIAECFDSTEVDRVAIAAHYEMIQSAGSMLEKAFLQGDGRPLVTNYAVQVHTLRQINSDLTNLQSSLVLSLTPFSQLPIPQLLLALSRCYVELILHCPFLNHLESMPLKVNLDAQKNLKRCFQAAVMVVETAEALGQHGKLNDAYFFTLETLSLAATSLLLATLSGHNSQETHSASARAYMLLSSLSGESDVAQSVLMHLTPLYQAASLMPPPLPSQKGRS